MTDHLTDARACVTSASQATDAGSAISWLTATCEQILDHLEAQQTEASLRRGLADITAGRTVDLGSFAQPATAPPAAQQGDSGHGDGGEAVQAAMAVLCDMGADSGGWHSWRCFDRELYPEPCDCTKQATRAAIAAAEPHIRAKIADEIEAMDLSDQYGPLTAHGARTDAIRRTTGAAMSYTPTTDEVEHRYAYDELYSMDCEADHRAFRRWLKAHDAEVRAQALAPIRAALAHHPRCDIHPDDDPITCGWKRAVASVQAVLDREEQP